MLPDTPPTAKNGCEFAAHQKALPLCTTVNPAQPTEPEEADSGFSSAIKKQDLMRTLQAVNLQQDKLLEGLHTLHIDMMTRLQGLDSRQTVHAHWCPPEALHTTQLRVTIVGARNLSRQPQSDLDDMYCTCWLSGRPGTEWRTSCVQANLGDPSWRECHDVLHFVRGDTLEFCVSCPRGLIGRASLSSMWFYPNGFDGEIPLTYVGKNKVGQLCVRVEFTQMEQEKGNVGSGSLSTFPMATITQSDNPVHEVPRQTSGTSGQEIPVRRTSEGSPGQHTAQDEALHSDAEEFSEGSKDKPDGKFNRSKTVKDVAQNLNHVVKYGQRRKSNNGQHLVKFVKGPHFELVCGIVILLNSAYMGYLVDSSVKFTIASPGRGPDARRSVLQDGIEVFFYSFYVVEFFLKLVAEQREFFCGEGWIWNVFDAFMVICGASDLISVFIKPQSAPPKLMWLRQLRFVKLVKMLRVVRVMRFFKELRVILNSIVGATRSFFWVIVMLVMITYLFSMVFIQGVVSYYEDMPTEVAQNPELEAYFGSLGRGMLILYQTVSGGMPWRSVASTLQNIGDMYFFLFLFYIAFLVFAVLRLLTGIFVQHAKDVVDLDREDVIRERILKKRAWQKEIQAIFVNIDDDGNGTINWEEFRDNYQCEAIQAYFTELELDTDDPWRTFKMLDMDNDGIICLSDFLHGCQRLKGHAKNVELVSAMTEVSAIAEQIDVMDRSLQDILSAARQTEQHNKDMLDKLSKLTPLIQRPPRNHSL